MTKKTSTINLQGKEYATVPARLKEFREANPKGEIVTSYEMLEGGDVVFTAMIRKDNSDMESASATGHAKGNLKDPKAFEKLETISVGRGLAMLGYLASGEIASSEEMTDFLEYKAQQEAIMLEDATEKLKDAKDIKALGKAWSDIPAEAKLKLADLKDELKVKLTPKETKDANK